MKNYVIFSIIIIFSIIVFPVLIPQSFGFEIGLQEGQWVKYKSNFSAESEFPDISRSLETNDKLFEFYDKSVDWHMITVESVFENSVVLVATNKIFDEEKQLKPYTIDFVLFQKIPDAIPIDSKIGDQFVTEHPLVGTLSMVDKTTQSIAGKQVNVFELTSEMTESMGNGILLTVNIRGLYDSETGILLEKSMNFLGKDGDIVGLNVDVTYSAIDFFVPDLDISKQSGKSEIKSKIPEWVRNNAGLWAEGQLGETDFLSGIQFMIKEKIIDIPDLPEQASDKSEEKVPDWIKSNAKWWADDLISEDEFVNGIKYLVEKGIIRV